MSVYQRQEWNVVEKVDGASRRALVPILIRMSRQYMEIISQNVAKH